MAKLIEHTGNARTEASLAAYYAVFTETLRAGIGAASMDMSLPYVSGTRAAVPPGAEDKIAFDRFHITQHVHGALASGAAPGEQGPAGTGRHAPGTQPVPVAARGTGIERGGSGTLHPVDGLKPEDGARLGYEGEPAHLVELSKPQSGRTVLEALVLLGHTQPAGIKPR